MSGDFDSPARRAVVATMSAVFGAVWGVKTTGLGFVPREGALIVACNHASLVDPPLLGVTLAPARKPRFLAKRELFSNPVMGRFFHATGTIPLDRATGDVSALKEALQTLEAGGSVAIFPEGTRVRGGERRPPRLGLSFLAAKAGAPVLPARAVGTSEFPRTFPLEMRFGPPMSPPRGGGREDAEAFARAVMDAIYAL